MRNPLGIVAVCSALVVGCGKQSAAPTPAAGPAVTVDVFAAASLAEGFAEIGKQFQAADGTIAVQFNFAGSQQLRAQLENGASADLFASANEQEMETAKAEALVDSASVHDFAANRLVVIYPKSNPAKIAALADLARPGVKIDVADVSVPVGKYTAKMLDAMSRDPAFGAGFAKAVEANVVSREENVKSVLSKVRLGEADAGVVYVTDVTADAGEDVATLAVPDGFNQIARYPIAVVAHSMHAEAARKLEDYILSEAGQKILRGYNFLPASAGHH
jgi:molybdate transport system substrate-binding protein